MHNNKLDNLDEIDKFLGAHKLPKKAKLKKRKENLNRPISSKGIKSVITGPDGFTDEFHPTFKEGLILLNLFQTIKGETLSDTFC